MEQMNGVLIKEHVLLNYNYGSNLGYHLSSFICCGILAETKGLQYFTNNKKWTFQTQDTDYMKHMNAVLIREYLL